MRKKKHYIALLLFVCLMAGCQSPTTTPESIATILETNCETEVPSIPETVEPEETAPGVDHYEAYQWMVNLHAEDVAFVEFIYLTDPSVSYRRYEGEEIQEVIDLFQAKNAWNTWIVIRSMNMRQPFSGRDISPRNFMW